MLVLSRKKLQTIKIGPDIYITVCKISGDRVRLGIEAPREMAVARMELLDRQEAERVAATDDA